MRETQFKWCTVLMQEGVTKLNQRDLLPSGAGGLNWWNRLTAGGKVLKLGWVNDSHGYGDVREIARVASEQVAQYQLHGVIFDFESAWEITKGGAGKAVPFCREWRRLRPGLLTALSSYAYPPYASLEWTVFCNQYGFRYLPQCYHLYAEYYKPVYSMQGAVKVGLPKSIVHPTLSREEGHVLADGISYALDAKAAGFTWGASIYLSDTLPTSEYSDMYLMQKATKLGLNRYI